MSAYQYNPDIIYKINPAPQYPDDPVMSDSKREHIEKFRRYMDRFKTVSPLKSKLEERYATGRLYAHLRQEELKQALRKGEEN